MQRKLEGSRGGCVVSQIVIMSILSLNLSWTTFILLSSERSPRRDFHGGPVVKTSPSNAGGVGSIPGPGAKIPRALAPKNQNVKQKQYCNKFNRR